MRRVYVRLVALLTLFVFAFSGTALGVPDLVSHREPLTTPPMRNGVPDVRDLFLMDETVGFAQTAPILSTGTGDIAATAATIRRIEGQNRYAAATAAALETFVSADTAVIVSGTQSWDPGVAAGLAGAVNGPVLATAPSALSPETALALQTLNVGHVILIGDASIISDAVVSAIKALSTTPTVERVGGSNLQDRVAAIAMRMKEELGTLPDQCIIADSWEGAMMAAPIAYSQHIPILGITGWFNEYTGVLEITNWYGTGTVRSSCGLTYSTLLWSYDYWVDPTRFSSSTTVIQDPDPARLSTMFAQHCVDEGWITTLSTVGVASGVDPLLCSPGVGSTVGNDGGLAFLVSTTRPGYCIDRFLYPMAGEISSVFLFGDDAAVSEDSEAMLADWSDPVPGAPEVTLAFPGNRGVAVNCNEATDVFNPQYGVWRATSLAGPYERLTVSENPWYWDQPLANGTTYYYKMSIIDADLGLEGPTGPPDAATPAPVEPLRISGNDRYATAIEISKWNFSRSWYAVIATGEAFPDALSASGLCGALDAPLLLTKKASLPKGLLGELDRLDVRQVMIIGSTDAVSAEVEIALQKAGYPTYRIQGRDRYMTAANVAGKVHDLIGNKASILVRGDQFADALSAAPWAYWYQIPIVLTRPDELPGSSSSFYSSRGIKSVIVVGGTAAVSDGVVASLPSCVVDVYRCAGSDRYKTSVAVARDLGSSTFDHAVIGVATGLNFPDALGGGVACGRWASPILLTSPSGVSPAAATYLVDSKSKVQEVQVYGGSTVLPDAILTSVRKLLVN